VNCSTIRRLAHQFADMPTGRSIERAQRAMNQPRNTSVQISNLVRTKVKSYFLVERKEDLFRSV